MNTPAAITRKAVLFLLLTAATTTAATPPKTLTAQQCAQQRAEWMVAHRWRGHAPSNVANLWRHARFEGVGWSGGPNMGTCRPRYRMALVADAYATDGRFSARVRLWR